MDFSLYRAAIAADKAYAQALRLAFGSRANEKRYDTNRKGWPAVTLASREAKLAADAAWRAEMQSTTKVG